MPEQAPHPCRQPSQAMADVSVGAPPHQGILGPGCGSGMRIAILGMVPRAFPPPLGGGVLRRSLQPPFGAADLTPTLDLSVELEEGNAMGVRGLTNCVVTD